MLWDKYPRWFGRRRRWSTFFDDWGFRDMDEMLEEMERMMDEMVREFSDWIPKGLVRERKLPDGSTFKEIGPFIWGWSMTMDPDGKPTMREFGNLKPSTEARPWEPPFNLKEEREPLVDMLENDRDLRVVAELPGVEKEDIRLYATEKTLTISVDAKEHKYHKEFELPVKVDPKSAKSSYRNGVLEVTLRRIEEKKPKGEQIKIE
jgi:HSP20 family protein